MATVTNRRQGPRAALLLGAAWGVARPVLALAADAALPAETTSLLTAIVKVFGALLVVVGLMVLLIYAIKRSGLGTGIGRSGSAITVLETRMVAPKRYIAIVDIAGQCLAVGITDQAINLLTALGPEARAMLQAGNTPSAKTGATFAGLLSKSIQGWQGKGVSPEESP